MTVAVQPRLQTTARGGRTVGRVPVAAALLVLALDGGTYGLTQRHSLALAVWWLLACGVALGAWRLPRLRSAVAATALALTALALLTAASMVWASDRESAFLESDRVALYLGVFALAALSGRGRKRIWCDGLAIGTVAIASVALASRFFPSLLPSHDLPRFLPGTAERLSYPVDYWNGLAVLLALGVPLLLRAAVDEEGVAPALVAGAIPALASAIFLTGSRTGVAAVLIATVVFVALADDPWRALATTFVVSVGSAAAIVVLLDRRVLVDGPLGSTAAVHAGHVAALLVPGVCLLTGFACYSTGEAVRRLPRPGRKVAVAAGALAITAVAVVAAVSHPRERVTAFAHAPTASALSQPNFVESHLSSTDGGGRWQFWRAAVAEFRSRPLSGGGAGSYEAWWAKHGSLPLFVRYAHSLYLEVLAELGVFGLALLFVGLGCAVITGVRALTRTRGVPRTTLAALLAAATAYLVAAGVDWLWQLTVVSVVGFACLGLLATTDAQEARETAGRSALVACVSICIAALVIAACETLPLLTGLEVQKSQAADQQGDVAGARAHASTAVRLEPWAASPYLQLALVEEQAQNLAAARRDLGRALARNPDDWRLWLVSARIDTKLGAIGAARASLARASELNPRSRIFTRVTRELTRRER